MMPKAEGAPIYNYMGKGAAHGEPPETFVMTGVARGCLPNHYKAYTASQSTHYSNELKNSSSSMLSSILARYNFLISLNIVDFSRKIAKHILLFSVPGNVQ